MDDVSDGSMGKSVVGGASRITAPASGIIVEDDDSEGDCGGAGDVYDVG